MKTTVRRSRQNRIERELVRTRVQAQLIRSQLMRKRRMIDKRPLERRNVAFVIDSLLKVAQKLRCNADQLKPRLPELIGNNVMLSQRRRLRRLINTQFKLKRPLRNGVHVANVLRQP